MHTDQLLCNCCSRADSPGHVFCRVLLGLGLLQYVNRIVVRMEIAIPEISEGLVVVVPEGLWYHSLA